MDGQSLDVLAENNLGLMLIADANHVLKERSSAKSLVVVLEALTFTRQRERLTRESCKANIKRRNILLVYLGDVSRNFKRIIEICPVGFLSILIPFGDKNRLSVGKSTLKTKADTANSCKKINEAKRGGANLTSPLVFEMIGMVVELIVGKILFVNWSGIRPATLY